MSGDTNYSILDRAFHRLAFSGVAVQDIAADIETVLYGNRFRHLPIERPLFITSLPRAGTTLVLELLARLPGIATHRYRDMPFVLAPILWDAISRTFRKPSDLRERAHGDGMTVGYDSAEAFEEIVWRRFWTEKYGHGWIELWRDDEDLSEFSGAFADHMRKIMALRSGEAAPSRYASKNNANIARLGVIRRMFPDAVLLVPVRDPVAQAVSLLHQHRRFAELHASDEFSRRYMEDIGHLEFGALHRPIRFDGMDDVRARYGPDTLDYWVAYWECAFRHVLTHRDSVVLLSYEALCATGSPIIPALAERIGVAVETLTDAVGERVRAPRDVRSDATIADADLARRTRALHAELLQASLIPVS
jgi:hypothetical protein